MDTFDQQNHNEQESPFGNSPYETSWQSHTENPAPEQDQPQTPPSYQAPPVYQAPSSAPAPKKKSSGNGWKAAAAACLAVALVAGSCAGTAAMVNSHWEKKTGEMNASFAQQFAQLQDQIDQQNFQIVNSGSSSVPVAPGVGMTPSQVYAQNVSSVVAISNRATTTNIFGQVSQTASSGSGFIISSDGYVVSNFHVVEGASELKVMTVDGKEYQAKVIGGDAGNDVALLKIEAENLHPVTIGKSDELIVGDQVVAIGNPLGELTSSLTVGYVSAKDRTINTDGTFINMVQIDAAINPGNSGGPLFNMKGEVIGINTAKYSGEAIEGIGFSIPIDDVMGIVSDLKEHGYVTGAYLGVSVLAVDANTSRLYGLPMGSLVLSVVEGGCAEKAGVRQQDIIVGLGEHEIASNTDLTRALRRFKAGDQTTITVYRAGETVELPITLDEKPAPVQQAPSADPTANVPENGDANEWYNYFAPFFGGR